MIDDTNKRRLGKYYKLAQHCDEDDLQRFLNEGHRKYNVWLLNHNCRLAKRLNDFPGGTYRLFRILAYTGKRGLRNTPRKVYVSEMMKLMEGKVL